MGIPAANARNSIRPRSGMWVRLPSGKVVQLIDHTSTRTGVVWSCGYVEGHVMCGPGVGNRGRLVLRHDWLQRFGELVR